MQAAIQDKTNATGVRDLRGEVQIDTLEAETIACVETNVDSDVRRRPVRVVAVATVPADAVPIYMTAVATREEWINDAMTMA